MRRNDALLSSHQLLDVSQSSLHFLGKRIEGLRNAALERLAESIDFSLVSGPLCFQSTRLPKRVCELRLHAGQFRGVLILRPLQIAIEGIDHCLQRRYSVSTARVCSFGLVARRAAGGCIPPGFFQVRSESVLLSARLRERRDCAVELFSHESKLFNHRRLLSLELGCGHLGRLLLRLEHGRGNTSQRVLRVTRRLLKLLLQLALCVLVTLPLLVQSLASFITCQFHLACITFAAGESFFQGGHLLPEFIAARLGLTLLHVKSVVSRRRSGIGFSPELAKAFSRHSNILAQGCEVALLRLKPALQFSLLRLVLRGRVLCFLLRSKQICIEAVKQGSEPRYFRSVSVNGGLKFCDSLRTATMNSDGFGKLL